MKKFAVLALMLLGVFTLQACGGEEAVEGPTYLDLNPYADVNWDEDTHLLANLHTHTQHSDGADTPGEVVDQYAEMGYGALAITDHDSHITGNSIAYPWTEFSTLVSRWEDRNPDNVGMIDIAGSEFSHHHHIVGLFTEYMGSADEEELELMQNVIDDDEDAVMFMAHPGRYWKKNTDYDPSNTYSPEWYENLYETIPQDKLVGMEIFNTDDRYPDDRILWDKLLTEFMPDRPIWANADDDYHDEEIGWSKTHHIMSDPSDKEEFRDTLINGEFYAHYTRTAGGEAPKVDEIVIDEDMRTIEIKVDGDYERVRWYSGYDEENNTSNLVHIGETFEYADFENSYIRAEIIKDEGLFTHAETVLQPFGFVQRDEESE